MKNSKLFLIVLVLSGMLLNGCSYNSMIEKQEAVKSQWAQVENVYQRSSDLIPNLVSTVKGYAAHESQTFEKVVQARNAAVAVPAGDVQAAAQANQVLGGALRGLLAVAESYPDLKANQNFLELQQALQNIETDLSSARRYYNATVRDYNTSIQQFPGVIVANITHFKPRDFFELEDKQEAQNVEVKF